MTIFKTLCITLCSLFLASTALGGSVATYTYGSGAAIPLLISQTTVLGTAEHCVDLFEDVTASIISEACEVTGTNEVIWPRDAQVDFLTIQHIVSGTAADACLFEVEVGGTSLLAGAITAVDQSDAVTTNDYAVNLDAGDLVGIVFSESTSCAGAAEVIVTLWGRWR